MNTFQDLEQRMTKIIKNENLVFNVGDVLRVTHLKPSQIHYWENRGYIKPVKRSKNKNHLYRYSTLIKIKMIQSYLKSGFTLKMANQKATHGYKMGHIISQMFLSRFRGLTKIDNQLALDMGPLASDPKKEAYLVKGGNQQVEIKIK